MEFVDLKTQYVRYKDEIDAEIKRVIDNASFINGPANNELENDLSVFCGAKHSIVCSSGTDALLIALMAYDIQPGDEILVPAFTFIATASMVSFYKAVPVFVDVDPVTFNIDPSKIEEKITNRTKGIIPVSLYGQCADFDEINAIANKYQLWVVEDAAQSFGASYKGLKSCSITDVSTTSFFPAKPLGCYGDGGAIFTNVDSLAEKMRCLISHGQIERYNHKYIGMNGRMDTIQSAVVKVKLKYFAQEIDLRNTIAEKYTNELKGIIHTPVVKDFNVSTWAQYSLISDKRELIRKALEKGGIPTAIHYPIPLNKQTAFNYLNDMSEYPVSEKLSNQVFSLPMHPYITDDDIDLIVSIIKNVC